MDKRYHLLLALFVLLFGRCASTSKITSVVERKQDGNMMLKWEVSPDPDPNEDINIYSAQSDASLSEFTPIRTSKINDHFTVINPSNPDTREFFILKTTTAFSGIITNRIIESQNVKNFRDAGGYFNHSEKQMRWGMIYRSGDLSHATLYDQEKMRRLNIKTVVDLRSVESASKYPILLHPSIKKISIPIVRLSDEIFEELMSNKNLTQADAIRKIQDSYIEIIENNKVDFANLFHLLSDVDNYPILLSGSLGKDRVGLAVYLILSAVGIPEYVILSDYMLSQQLIDVSKIVEDVHSKPEYFQEAVTALMSVKPSYLNYTIDYINQKYGSVNNYIQKELKISSGQINALNRILFYTP